MNVEIASDSKQKVDSVVSNISSIDIRIISEIQKDLDAEEIISIVFLLYEEPYVAVERLTLFQRLLENDEHPYLNLLYDWAVKAQAKTTWRYEFLEALAICQLFSVIRKLGFDVEDVKRHFLPLNILVTIFVHPIKKVLFKICDSLCSNYLEKLKCSLHTFKTNIESTDFPELIFLKLLCSKFITLGHWKDYKKQSELCDVEKLAQIFGNMAGMKEFGNYLFDAESLINRKFISAIETQNTVHFTGTETKKTLLEEFGELNDMCKDLFDEEIEPAKLKTDAKQFPLDAYKIICPSEVGICYIINQVNFHPSMLSIERGYNDALEDRLGSHKDQEVMEATMRMYGIKVYTERNLDHQAVINNIKKVVKEKVKKCHSLFVLCILSHGVEGGIYGSDCIPVKVKDIQNILDGNEAQSLLGKPKIIIIQACQGNEPVPTRIVTDGPKHERIATKTDFLVYWATLPEFYAYRDVKKGSIFIQLLCFFIGKKGKKEHLLDIFTSVTEVVSNYEIRHEKALVAQVPIFNSTLRKKLYLIPPE